MKKIFLPIIILFSLLVIFAVSIPAVVFSAGNSNSNNLEVTYPQIPGLPKLDSSASIGDYARYLFGLLVYIGGLAALISFVVGAVQLINPNIEAHNDAKDRMKSAVIGLVLTVSSFLILQTINYKLVTPTLTPLSSVAGIFYTDGSGHYKAAPQENPDTSIIPQGFSTIKYCCNSGCNGGTGPALLIWVYNQKNFGDYQNANVNRIECNGTSSVGQSFQMSFETPGVYYCLNGCSGNMCSGFMSGPNTTSQDNVGTTFAGKIKGVRFVGSDHYGVIFHKESGLDNGGTCNRPLEATNGSCQAVPNPASTFAADIFALNENPGASGDGVTFYSEPFGWDAGENAGYFPVQDNEITTSLFSLNASTDMDYEYKNVDETGAYQAACSNFQDCPGSIRIKGSYLVALYSNGSYCQTFSKDVSNLDAQPITANGMGQDLNAVDIIPIQ